MSQNKKIIMKTNDKNLLETKSVICRIAEIRELIEQIKDQLSEIRKSDDSNPKLYAVNAEIFNTERSLEPFEIQLVTLSKLFS
jgi:cell shape-determining protein MreC